MTDALDRARHVIDEGKRADAAAQRMLRPDECAERLTVTGEFIRGEIRDGKLPARVFTRGRRRRYRIEPADFEAYIDRYWPRETFHVERIAT
jgi:excisionase family DNA binding protein